MSHTAPVSARTFRSREAAHYWAGLDEGVVRFQHCTACDQAIFYPRTFCPYCMRQDAIEWRTSSGNGTLYTYSELFEPPNEAERDRIPYVLGIVEMNEGFYLFGEIVADRSSLRIGMPTRTVVIERNGVRQLNFLELQ